MQRVPVPKLCTWESWAGSTPQNLLQVKDFACREQPSCTDMWLDQVSAAGLSTERICAGVIYSPSGMGYSHFISREIKHVTK